MSEKRLKIFVSAYACEPVKGSEPGIGWNVVNELARYHEVHVLTRNNNRASIEAALIGKSDAQPLFHYYDLLRWLSFWKKKRRGYRLYYYLWQYGAFFRYRKFVNSYRFDIVQHLTFANFAMPSLFMLCKGTTVWGPIGLVTTHPAIWKSLPLKVKIKETLRLLVMNILSNCEPMRFLTPRKAELILESGRKYGESCFPENWQAKIIQHPQTGINTSEPEYQQKRQRLNDGKVRLLICSEFIHWKGVTFAAELFGRISSKYDNVELWIYGTGPEKANMQKILQRYGAEEKVFWLGFVDKATLMQGLLDADILLYPSYHHGLATVILQAMYARLPIVTIAGDPIAVTVAKGGGVVADGSTLTEIMHDMEQKTIALIESPEQRTKIGNSEYALIEKCFEWRILVKKLSELFLEIPTKAR